MSSIRKRTLPSGKICWQLNYRDSAGVRRAKQFKAQKLALDYETVVRSQLRDGLHVPDRMSVTVEQAAALWLERCRIEGLEPSTLKQYEQHVRLHILPIIGATKLSRLPKTAVEAFRDKLVETTSSRAMARKVMISLKGLLSEAHRLGLIVQNTATGTKVKLNSRDEEKARIPDKNQIRSILTTALAMPVQEVSRALVVVALFSGLRASELRGLDWAHIDLDRRVIKVRQRADFRGRLGSPKSRAGNRDVPLSPMAVNTLRQWRLCCPKTEAGLVFPTSHGGIITHSGIHRIWHNLLDAAGIPWEKSRSGKPKRYRFHDLRHVAASLFIEQGWQPKKIMEVMGHSSIKITFDLYGHLWKTPESDQEAMAQIEARLLR
jgi:integrase